MQSSEGARSDRVHRDWTTYIAAWVSTPHQGIPALGVLGLGRLLLTQVRYEHPASIKDAEAQELATREVADMRRADSASAQLIRDGLDGLPAGPAGLN